MTAIPEPRLAEIDAHEAIWMSAAEKAELVRGYRAGRSGPVPDGWKLVPVKPTDEMKSFAYATDTDRNEWPSHVWAFMLAGAPAPPTDDSGDPIVDAVRAKLAERSRVGQAKYGHKLTRDDLSLFDWLNHLQQELMDGANYCEAAMRKAKADEAQRDALAKRDAEIARLRADAERLDFMDRLCEQGCAPSIVNDDDGRWAFSDSGTSPVPEDGGHRDTVVIDSYVDPEMWRPTIREAIDAAIAAQSATQQAAG